jgi:hypothetical protein
MPTLLARAEKLLPELLKKEEALTGVPTAYLGLSQLLSKSTIIFYLPVL